eukprot:gnl/MRDRNA2_/MRDRNA2_70029_c0_seq1.p1 gnl/MRDRNA2_/MRDRNA2_70029_c0~~gnl/MRDRNA2_/MRDRNA2_70029_c0_seq1.p1  ORF type:complete len:763 (-),score=98.42 gnl/MRDRNA2_/MRDRNA2_70029_c0_seq1:105-2219(-)
MATAIENPFAVQVFGIMFAFLITNRVTRAIGRWWDGLLTINQMYRSLYNAFAFIMFNVDKEQKLMKIQSGRTDLSAEDKAWVQHRLKQLEDFSHKMIHWFSLINALALGQLKYGEERCLEYIHCLHHDYSWMNVRIPSRHPLTDSKIQCERNTFLSGQEKSTSLTYLGEISAEEAKILSGVEDKMYLVSQFIMQSLVIADTEKIIDIAAPVLNRVYSMVEEGVSSYESAYKLAAVPYPYPLAQMMQVLMYAYMILIPIVIEKFTGVGVLTPFLSCLIVLCYWGLDRVARELENPFGEDANDLPLHDFCATYNDTIQQMAQVQNQGELDHVFTFSDLCSPAEKRRVPHEKPEALSKPPVEALAKIATDSKTVPDPAGAACQQMVSNSNAALPKFRQVEQVTAPSPAQMRRLMASRSGPSANNHVTGIPVQGQHMAMTGVVPSAASHGPPVNSRIQPVASIEGYPNSMMSPYQPQATPWHPSRTPFPLGMQNSQHASGFQRNLPTRHPGQQMFMQHEQQSQQARSMGIQSAALMPNSVSQPVDTWPLEDDARHAPACSILQDPSSPPSLFNHQNIPEPPREYLKDEEEASFYMYQPSQIKIAPHAPGVDHFRVGRRPSQSAGHPLQPARSMTPPLQPATCSSPPVKPTTSQWCLAGSTSEKQSQGECQADVPATQTTTMPAAGPPQSRAPVSACTGSSVQDDSELS